MAEGQAPPATIMWLHANHGSMRTATSAHCKPLGGALNQQADLHAALLRHFQRPRSPHAVVNASAQHDSVAVLGSRLHQATPVNQLPLSGQQAELPG